MWFKKETESNWKRGWRYDSLVQKTAPMERWERNLKWVGGQSPEQIDRMEKIWKCKFPPDYKLFLGTLFGLNNKKESFVFNKKNERIKIKTPIFNNWLKDGDTIRDYQRGVFHGILFDIENNNLWLPGWGKKPKSRVLRKRRLRELLLKAPKVIPILERRFLLIEPCRAENPVFSIHQSDIVVYGPTLRTYLLNEFFDVLAINIDPEWEKEFKRKRDFIKNVPFWGELLEHNKKH